MEEYIQITPTTDELTIIHKKALDELPPHNFHIDGNIHSVASFITDRFNKSSIQSALPSDSVVIADITKGTLTLTINPDDRYSSTVTGKLVANPDLDLFKINTNKMYDRDELLKLIRFNSYRITNPKPLIEELQKLRFQASITTQNAKDKRGNLEGSISKSITSEIPTSFILKMPIYQGSAVKAFMVDIVMETSDASVKFWLESTELHQLLVSERDEILNEEIDKITKNNILVLFTN